jgi:exosortase A-associated hydrolase 1
MSSEVAFSYDRGHGPQVGIYHPSAQPSRQAIVFVVGGGPQYRVGGHRQLVQWARALAQAGHHVLRFDSTGMGDSHGSHAGFEALDADIRAAIDQIALRVPELKRVTLWGECNAASAIVFYGFQDPRVTQMVLLNPWARTEQGQARTVIRHYYLQRLQQASFWRKLLSLRLNPLKVIRSGLTNLRLSMRTHAGSTRKTPPAAQDSAPSKTHYDADGRRAPLSSDLPLPDRLRLGIERFQGSVLLVMSGRDHIAREFDAMVAGSPAWRTLLARQRLERLDLAQADHTFSTQADKRAVAEHAIGWLKRTSPP